MTTLAAAVVWLAAQAVDAPQSAVVLAPLSDDEIADARRPLPPKHLRAKPGRQSLSLNGDARVLFEQVAKAYGLDVVFDGDFQAGQRRRLQIDDADYGEAIRVVESATACFVVPVSEKLFLAVKDTPQKRQEVEPTVAVVVAVPNPVTVQETQELARSVQQTIEIQKLVVDTGRRLVLVRDRVSKALAARELLEQLMGHKATVSIEVEILSISKTFSQSLGVSPPTSFTLSFLGLPQWIKSAVSADVGAYLAFAGGHTLWGIGVGSAQVIATLTRGLGHQRQLAHISSVDGQPATFLAGERYPILTAGYYGPTPDRGQVYAPPPNVQWEDLGLTLKVTPRVHSYNEVTLELEADFKQLAGASINGIPVISARKYQSRLRVGAGEWAAVGGLVSQSDSKTRSGYPFLANLPWIGRLFGIESRTDEATEFLVLLKPQVTSLVAAESPSPAFWVGTESRPLTVY